MIDKCGMCGGFFEKRKNLLCGECRRNHYNDLANAKAVIRTAYYNSLSNEAQQKLLEEERKAILSSLPSSVPHNYNSKIGKREYALVTLSEDDLAEIFCEEAIKRGVPSQKIGKIIIRLHKRKPIEVRSLFRNIKYRLLDDGETLQEAIFNVLIDYEEENKWK